MKIQEMTIKQLEAHRRKLVGLRTHLTNEDYTQDDRADIQGSIMDINEQIGAMR